jgi:hypothetical protein
MSQFAPCGTKFHKEAKQNETLEIFTLCQHFGVEAKPTLASVLMARNLLSVTAPTRTPPP